MRAGPVNPPQGGGGMADQLGGVAGRVGELEAGGVAEIRLAGGERAVMQEDLHMPGEQPIPPELLGGTGDVGDQGFLDRLELGQLAAEHAGDDQPFPRRRGQLQRNAGRAA